MTQLRAHQKRDIMAMFVMFAMVHATNALYITYIPLYLEDLAFGAAVRGVLLSIGPFVSMLTQTMWGGLADRSKNKSYVMYALSIGLVLVTTLFLASDFAGIDKILPAIIAGCITAALFAVIGKHLNITVLKKVFGGLLLLTGLRELLYRARNAR